MSFMPLNGPYATTFGPSRPAFTPPEPKKQRMTEAQLLKLWNSCERWGVTFNETDYYIEKDTGYALSWVDGHYHNGEPSNIASGFKKTIYLCVEPNGDSHS